MNYFDKVEEFKKFLEIKEDVVINENGGGVYAIYSKNTGFCYVGETCDINRRFKEHLSDLKNNEHDRNKLQELYNEYGKESLEFIPICNCKDFERKGLEGAYIKRLGNKAINVGDCSDRFKWVRNGKNKILLDAIPKKYRIIIENHMKWKKESNKINEYLILMCDKGKQVFKDGFKHITKIENMDNKQIIQEYIDEYIEGNYDFGQMQLDYVAIAIMNDILGNVENKHVFNKGRLKFNDDFPSDDLIYNIYKDLRRDGMFLTDFIKASTSLCIYSHGKKFKCILSRIKNIYGHELKINNIFDLLYCYLLYLFICEIGL